MTNKEAIKILCGKAPLIIRDRTGNAYDKTEELKTTIIAALELEPEPTAEDFMREEELREHRGGIDYDK